MILVEGIRIAFWVLWNNKMRSILTLLCNVVSVMSLVGVVSVIEGVNRYVKEKIADKGTGVFEIQRLDPLEFLTDPDRFVKALKNPPLDMEDAAYLRHRLKQARAVGAKVQTQVSVRRGSLRLE